MEDTAGVKGTDVTAVSHAGPLARLAYWAVPCAPPHCNSIELQLHNASVLKHVVDASKYRLLVPCALVVISRGPDAPRHNVCIRDLAILVASTDIVVLTGCDLESSGAAFPAQHVTRDNDSITVSISAPVTWLAVCTENSIVTKVIGAAGGTIDGPETIIVTVPPGAVAGDTEFKVCVLDDATTTAHPAVSLVARLESSSTDHYTANITLQLPHRIAQPVRQQLTAHIHVHMASGGTDSASGGTDNKGVAINSTHITVPVARPGDYCAILDGQGYREIEVVFLVKHDGSEIMLLCRPQVRGDDDVLKNYLGDSKYRLLDGLNACHVEVPLEAASIPRLFAAIRNGNGENLRIDYRPIPGSRSTTFMFSRTQVVEGSDVCIGVHFREKDPMVHHNWPVSDSMFEKPRESVMKNLRRLVYVAALALVSPSDAPPIGDSILLDIGNLDKPYIRLWFREKLLLKIIATAADVVTALHDVATSYQPQPSSDLVILVCGHGVAEGLLCKDKTRIGCAEFAAYVGLCKPAAILFNGCNGKRMAVSAYAAVDSTREPHYVSFWDGKIDTTVCETFSKSFFNCCEAFVNGCITLADVFKLARDCTDVTHPTNKDKLFVLPIDDVPLPDPIPEPPVTSWMMSDQPDDMVVSFGTSGALRGMNQGEHKIRCPMFPTDQNTTPPVFTVQDWNTFRDQFDQKKVFLWYAKFFDCFTPSVPSREYWFQQLDTLADTHQVPDPDYTGKFVIIHVHFVGPLTEDAASWGRRIASVNVRWSQPRTKPSSDYCAHMGRCRAKKFLTLTGRRDACKGQAAMLCTGVVGTGWKKNLYAVWTRALPFPWEHKSDELDNTWPHKIDIPYFNTRITQAMKKGNENIVRVCLWAYALPNSDKNWHCFPSGIKQSELPHAAPAAAHGYALLVRIEAEDAAKPVFPKAADTKEFFFSAADEDASPPSPTYYSADEYGWPYLGDAMDGDDVTPGSTLPRFETTVGTMDVKPTAVRTAIELIHKHDMDDFDAQIAPKKQVGGASNVPNDSASKESPLPSLRSILVHTENLRRRRLAKATYAKLVALRQQAQANIPEGANKKPWDELDDRCKFEYKYVEREAMNRGDDSPDPCSYCTESEKCLMHVPISPDINEIDSSPSPNST